MQVRALPAKILSAINLSPRLKMAAGRSTQVTSPPALLLESKTVCLQLWLQHTHLHVFVEQYNPLEDQEALVWTGPGLKLLSF